MANFKHEAYSKTNQILLYSIFDKKTTGNGLILVSATIDCSFLTKSKPIIGDTFETPSYKDQSFKIVEIVSVADAKGILFNESELNTKESYRDRYDRAVRRIAENGNDPVFNDARITFKVEMI